MLPIRAALYTLSDNAFWLIGVQLLDGVGAGIYGALTRWSSPTSCAAPADITSRRALSPPRGIGASISALFAGEMVDHFGYSVSFLALGAAAAIAFLVFFAFMPETRDEQATERASAPRAIEGAAGE